MVESLPEATNPGVDPEVMGDIVQFLVRDGLVTDAQVGHAAKVQNRLDTPRRLLEVLQDLGYISQKQVKECLLNNRTNIRIGSLLVELGYISEKQLTLALTKQKQDGKRRRLGEVLVGNNYISHYDLTQVLSIHLGFPYVEPNPAMVDTSLLERAKATLFLEHQFIPLKREDGRVTVAMVDPMDQKAIEAARRLYGSNIVRPSPWNGSFLKPWTSWRWDYRMPGMWKPVLTMRWRWWTT